MSILAIICLILNMIISFSVLYIFNHFISSGAYNKITMYSISVLAAIFWPFLLIGLLFMIVWLNLTWKN